MNVVVEPKTPGNGTGDSQNTPARRIYAGECYPQSAPATQAAYVALVPTDDDLSRDALIRLMVADALQRNGKVVDEDTLEATMARATAPGGVFAETPLVYKLVKGETRSDGTRAPPFVGYELPISADAQKKLLDYTTSFEAQRKAAPEPPVDGAIKELKGLAQADGKNDVVRTLEAVDAAIKASQTSRQAGEPIDKTALAGVMEYFTVVGKEREAAKILERYTAIKNVVGDVKEFGQNAERVFNGRDPVTNTPIDTDRRVDAAFDLLNNGFKIAGGVGTAASLLGVGGRVAPALLGVAPVGIAIVGFAAGAYSLIKHIRAEILAPRWDEIRERFPFCPDGMDPKKAIKQILRNIDGMPLDGDNALSTATRIMDGIGQNPETRARFAQFLKGKVEPDSLVDALAAGRPDALTREQAMQLARAAKDSGKGFFDLEVKDAKRYIKDRDGERTRGTYLFEGDSKAAAERNTSKLSGTLDEALRVLGVASDAVLKFKALKDELGGQIGGLKDGSGKPVQLSETQKASLPSTLAAEGLALQRPLSLMLSNDGTKLLAVSNPASESRQIIAVPLDANPAAETIARTVAEKREKGRPAGVDSGTGTSTNTLDRKSRANRSARTARHQLHRSRRGGFKIVGARQCSAPWMHMQGHQ